MKWSFGMKLAKIEISAATEKEMSQWAASCKRTASLKPMGAKYHNTLKMIRLTTAAVPPMKL